jgi:hypothetical protein
MRWIQFHILFERSLYCEAEKLLVRKGGMEESGESIFPLG